MKGAGFFVSDEPDVMLTEIHRQAFDNPIIRMSMLVREGGRLVAGSYGDSALADEPDQILAGRNVTRHSINARERKKRGRKGVLPCAGDKLVCLRNNYRQGLLNGAIWVAHEVHTSASGVHMVVVPEDDDGGGAIEVTTHAAFFTGEEEKLPWQVRREFDEFDSATR